MAQPETLYQVLSQPLDASRVKQLHTVHEAIKASLAGQQPGSRVGLETLVVCAEAALKVCCNLHGVRNWFRGPQTHAHACSPYVGM